MRRPAARLLAELLRPRRGPLGRMAAWTVVEVLPAALSGRLLAGALDQGFLAGRPLAGCLRLLAFGMVTVVGAFGSRQVYPQLADVVEPVRDALTRRVVLAELHRPATRADRPDPAAVARLTRQVETVRDSLAGQLLIVRQFAFTLVFVLLGAASLHPLLLLLIGGPLAVALLAFTLLLPRLATRQRAVLQAEEAYARLATTTFTGLRDVLACGAAGRAADDLDAALTTLTAARRRAAAFAALRRLTVALGTQLPAVLILLTAPALVARHTLTPGEVVGALGYLTVSLEPALHTLVQGLGASGLRLAVTAERLAATTGIHTTAAAPEHVTPAATVTLEDVTFRYAPGAAPVLDGLSLTLGPEEHLAVVGPSGAGKSTLADLLAGLARPERGVVRLHGAEPGRLPPAELPYHRVLIPQEAYVFTGTLRENLTLLAPAATTAELTRVCELFDLRSLLKEGLDTLLSPAALTPAERQLLALARSYLSPAPLAVLDEATSLLDPAAEARAERAFRDRPGALVVIAHRLASARRADRVLLLGGEGAALGTHAELLRRSPEYARLVSAGGGCAAPGSAPRTAGRWS